MIEFAAVVIGCYLIGSIPFGLVLGKLRGIDVREYGSGKVGSTNVLRTLGAKPAAVALLADVAKGVIAVLLARFILGSYLGEMAAGFSAIAGHNWSVFIKFRGGRGVATSLGVLLTMAPFVALAGLAIFTLTIFLYRYVSLGSILGALSAALVLGGSTASGRAPLEYFIFAVVAAGLIVFQHQDNISRLLAGKESKLGQKVEKRQPQ